jgi:membrane protein DedA with SNARE-associated domain
MIADYGGWFYAITFIWTFFEGETFVIIAASLAAQGYLDPLPLGICAWLGSFSGDQLYFFIGRRYGGVLLRRFPDWRHGVDAALDWLRRYSTYFVLGFRFTYGVRNFSSFAMGMSGLAWPRFFVLNLTAAAIWATTFVGAGYLLGRAFESVLGRLADSFPLVMLGVFAVSGTIVFLVHRAQKRKAARRPSPPLQTEGEDDVERELVPSEELDVTEQRSLPLKKTFSG